MNEIALIQGQLAAEKSRASAVAEACLRALEREHGAAEAVGEFRSACVDYLVRVLAAFEERDQRLADVLRALPTDGSRERLERALALPGRSRDALEKLQSACASPPGALALAAWRTFEHELVHGWGARREALAGLLAANTRVADWRAIGGIDADSIIEERRGYAQVCALLPAGVLLPPVGAR
jgi:hypothetical protein